MICGRLPLNLCRLFREANEAKQVADLSQLHAEPGEYNWRQAQE